MLAVIEPCVTPLLGLPMGREWLRMGDPIPCDRRRSPEPGVGREQENSKEKHQAKF